MKFFIINKIIKMKDGSFFKTFESSYKDKEQIDHDIIKIINHYNNEKIIKNLQLFQSNISFDIVEINFSQNRT